MKTVFVSLDAGQEIRNFLYGDFYKIAKENSDVRIIVFLPEDKIETYRDIFSHERCIIEPTTGIDRGWRAKKIFRIMCLGCVPTATIKSRIWFSYLNGGSILHFLLKYFFWILGHFRAWRAFMRTLEYYIFRDDRVWESYFEKYHPDVVFGAGFINEVDITLIKYAKRRGIPTVGMMRSWDNFTSKGFLRVHPDLLLVQNPRMVEEAVHLNSFPRERIRVVGFPQWDHYVDSSWHIPKEELAKIFGADPTKRWLVYFGGGLMAGLFNLPETGDHVVMLNRAIARGDIENAQVLIRPHPSPYHVRALRDEVKKNPILTFGKGWDFRVEDLKLLMNLIRVSDVTMNMGSTTTLEAAIFDKPTILIGFNGFESDAGLRWSQRLSVALDNTLHYQEVEHTGGVWRVSDEKDLIHATRTYLERPSLHKEGRARLVRELVGPLDGKAGERIFNAILGACQNNHL